jgi:hypothetical protein
VFTASDPSTAAPHVADFREAIMNRANQLLEFDSFEQRSP